MKALVISDVSPLADDINDRLNDIGYDSVLLTTGVKHDTSHRRDLSQGRHRRRWLRNATRAYWHRNVSLRADSRYAYFQDIDEDSHYYALDRFKSLVRVKPKVIFVLFDYRVVTTGTIRALHEWSGAKIFWLLVDMKPMTGGCSYSLGCLGYESNCGSCPAIRSARKSYASQTLRKKVENLADVDLTVVTFSTFQYSQAKRSTLFRSKDVTKTFFPIDHNLFTHGDRSEARKVLGLPQDKKILLAGSSSLGEYRKGWHHLIASLRMLREHHTADDLVLLLVGNPEGLDTERLGVPVISLGFQDYRAMPLVYQASDLFLCPTIADSGPTMVNQSIMCGTPVVAFDMGVSGDLVTSGETGYLAQLGSDADLCRGLIEILSLNERDQARYRENCMAVAARIRHDNFFALARQYYLKAS